MFLRMFAEELYLKKAYIIMGFFFMMVPFVYGQQIANIDSLEAVYSKKNLKTNEKLNILRTLSRDHNNPQKKLEYSDELITLATAVDSTYYLYDAYIQKGNALRLKSDLTKALETFLIAARIATKTNNTKDLALTNVTIADAYSVMGNHENAIDYYNKGITMLRAIKTDSINLASALLNAGDEYLNAKKYDQALTYFFESSLICKKVNFRIGAAYNIGNIGTVYAEQGKDDLAKANINEAIKILEEENDFYPIAVYLTYMADIYIKHKDWKLAQGYAESSLLLAKKYQLKDQISEANLRLSTVNEAIGNTSKALDFYKNHIAYKDSVNNIVSVQKMANLRTEFEVDKKQVEVDLLNEQKKNQRFVAYGIGAALIVTVILAFGLFRRTKYIEKTRKIIEQERNRSDELLHNILPEETAIELKEEGSVQAKKFESVTVLFTDFKGFTHFAENLPPEELVRSVDFYFSKFDEIMDTYQLEKIKTIGDAYMCVGGLPFPSNDHAERMAKAAFDILEFVNEAKRMHSVNESRFEVRIGMHTGPVVAGVVGTKKFTYDVWGDTVNIASRMETSSEPGKINISESTYQLLKDKYDCTYRGEVTVKNRSAMKMYYLEKPKHTT